MMWQISVLLRNSYLTCGDCESVYRREVFTIIGGIENQCCVLQEVHRLAQVGETQCQGFHQDEISHCLRHLYLGLSCALLKHKYAK